MTLVQTNCCPERRRPSLSTLLNTWIGLARQRRALASLTQTQLDDIGVTAQEAETEVNRPVWDVPASWRR